MACVRLRYQIDYESRKGILREADSGIHVLAAKSPHDLPQLAPILVGQPL